MTSLTVQEPNYLYDLSNPHFENTTIVLDDGRELKGRFVQFRVVAGEVEYLYPAEKYCFLPEENQKLFWKEYEWNQGAFTHFPSYVLQLSMDHIRKITISPELVP